MSNAEFQPQPLTDKSGFMVIGMRLIELRLKVAALKRAEALVQDNLGVKTLYSVPSDPNRYAEMFKKIDATLTQVELSAGAPMETWRQIATTTNGLEREVCDLVGAWILTGEA